MAVIMDLPMSWILLLCTSVFSVIVFVVICVCCQTRKKSSQAYVMDSNESSRTELANNNVPEIITQNKQKYFFHGVTYSSINSSDEFPGLANPTDSTNDHFSFNILNIFKNIQRNKYADSTSEVNKVLGENLEDSRTDSMHRNFERSVLCLQWNDSATQPNRSVDKEETYSCISDESKGTFISAVPSYNRSYSVADTFKSTNSKN